MAFIHYPVEYKKPSKDIVRSIRIPKTLVDESKSVADRLGISWSDFVRQGINRNIYIAVEAEKRLQEEIARISIGEKNEQQR